MGWVRTFGVLFAFQVRGQVRAARVAVKVGALLLAGWIGLLGLDAVLSGPPNPSAPPMALPEALLDPTPVLLVDPTGRFGARLSDHVGDHMFVTDVVPDGAPLEEALRTGRLRGILEVDATTLEDGSFRFRAGARPSPVVEGLLEGAVQRAVRDTHLAEAGLLEAHQRLEGAAPEWVHAETGAVESPAAMAAVRARAPDFLLATLVALLLVVCIGPGRKGGGLGELEALGAPAGVRMLAAFGSAGVGTLLFVAVAGLFLGLGGAALLVWADEGTARAAWVALATQSWSAIAVDPVVRAWGCVVLAYGLGAALLGSAWSVSRRPLPLGRWGWVGAGALLVLFWLDLPGLPAGLDSGLVYAPFVGLGMGLWNALTLDTAAGAYAAGVVTLVASAVGAAWLLVHERPLRGRP